MSKPIISISADKPYRNWYDLPRWRRQARAQLRNEPLCRLCKSEGQIVAAEVADHIIPHKGDLELFWHGELQSLCRRCHNRTKHHIETLGYIKTVGVDGLPIDPRHPFNQTGGVHNKNTGLMTTVRPFNRI